MTDATLRSNRILAVTLTVVLCALGFAAIAWAVKSDITQIIDEEILILLRTPNNLADPIGPDWLEEAGRDLTSLGGKATLGLISIAAAGYFLLVRRWRAFAHLTIAVLGGMAVAVLMKELIDRPRPSVVPHLSHVTSNSFPSGHSLLSAVVYLTLALIVTARVEFRGRRRFFFGIAVLLTILVGVSRVFVGVHYPTDVMAGWLAGVAWVCVCYPLRERSRHTPCAVLDDT